MTGGLMVMEALAHHASLDAVRLGTSVTILVLVLGKSQLQIEMAAAAAPWVPAANLSLKWVVLAGPRSNCSDGNWRVGECSLTMQAEEFHSSWAHPYVVSCRRPTVEPQAVLLSA